MESDIRDAKGYVGEGGRSGVINVFQEDIEIVHVSLRADLLVLVERHHVLDENTVTGVFGDELYLIESTIYCLIALDS